MCVCRCLTGTSTSCQSFLQQSFPWSIYHCCCLPNIGKICVGWASTTPAVLRLSSLQPAYCPESVRPRRTGAAACPAHHIFPATRALPQLQSQRLRSTCCDAMWCLTAANLHWQRHQRTPRLAWRCRVRFVTGGVKALLNLPACCSELTVGGQAFDDGSVCLIA